jgi:hypothetical protein
MEVERFKHRHNWQRDSWYFLNCLICLITQLAWYSSMWTSNTTGIFVNQ